MAFYRKKRRKAGPSKNDKKVSRAQTAEALGVKSGDELTFGPGIGSHK